MKRPIIGLSAITAGILLAFVLGSMWAADLLGLEGRGRWILISGLSLLGLATAGLLFGYLAPRLRRKAAAAPPPDEEMENLLTSAQSRLAASGLKGGAKLSKLPLVLVLGPNGSTKTSTIVNSGLEPELLAGEVHRGDLVAPTEAVNVWYAQGTVFLEAGGRLLGDASRWSRLVRRIQPGRLGAALARGRQAPRAVVVCFGCDELLRPGSSESVPAAARKLRGHLGEISQQLGIRLPVYVVFTKADRLPHFGDYVRNLSAEEAREVLGCTLPLAGGPPAASYAEQESRRLGDAFQGIFRTLAAKRLDILPREGQEDIRGGAYEFPRELRKASGLAVQFLVELCKPSQLGASPFLRGFYFSGVRAVIVSDGAQAARAAQPASPDRVQLGATSVFQVGQIFGGQSAPAPAPTGSRKVPEWVFLPRIFRDVVLQDQAVRSLTGSGTRVHALRRAMLAGSAAVFLLLFLGFSYSYRNNRLLVREAVAATRGVETLVALDPQTPSLEEMRRLDALRAEAEETARLERDGRPWRLGWGLYTGDRVQPEVRRAYFDRFGRLLWGDTRGRMLASLQGLPDAPTASGEYGSAYETLRAHLVTTSHPAQSTTEFLTPVLMRYWTNGRELSPEHLETARRQFDFFGAELPHGNPLPGKPDEVAVGHSRLFLGAFAGEERFYQAMLSEAGKSGSPVEFARVSPASAPFVRNEVVVPAAFTKEGWKFVQANRNNVDKLLSGEEWVLGPQTIPAEDRARLIRDLHTRYVADYVRTWQEYLRAGAVVGFTGPGDAAQKLMVLSGNQSPLLQMLALASVHTAVDSVLVGKAFQPLHAVVPPGSEKLVTDANKDYMASLGSLASALGQVMSTPAPMRAQAATQASFSSGQVEGEVRKLSQAFSIDGEARVTGDAVQRALLSPVGIMKPVLAGVAAEAVPGEESPAAALNKQGAPFCRAVGQLAGSYPFNPRGTTEATIDDVAAVLEPGSSVVWEFYDGSLQDVLVRQGARYSPKIGGAVQPTSQFVAFFNRAAEISGAMFDESGAGPRVDFVLRPQTSAAVPEVTVSVDGKSRTFTRTVASSETFSWDGARAREARVTAKIGGADVTVAEGRGTWGLFRAMQKAEWQQSDRGRYLLTWRVPGQDAAVTAELLLAGGVPVLNPAFLDGLNCAPRIAR